MENFIRIYDDVLSKDFCQTLIWMFENDQTKSAGKVASGQVAQHKHSTDLLIDPGMQKWKDIDHVLQRSSESCFAKYRAEFSEHFKFFGNIDDTGYLMMKYDANVGGFDTHSDVNSVRTNHRFLSGIWYLNDVEEGGETEFPTQQVSVKPVAGRMVLFPAYFTHLHRGNPAKQDKYIVNMFKIHV